MAIDVEGIVMDALLALVEEDGVALERVTVKRLLERSGVSRQTFYNHFLDKNDLICQVYERRMVSAFTGTPSGFAYRDELERSLAHMRAHAGQPVRALIAPQDRQLISGEPRATRMRSDLLHYARQ